MSVHYVLTSRLAWSIYNGVGGGWWPVLYRNVSREKYLSNMWIQPTFVDFCKHISQCYLTWSMLIIYHTTCFLSSKCLVKTFTHTFCNVSCMHHKSNTPYRKNSHVWSALVLQSEDNQLNTKYQLNYKTLQWNKWESEWRSVPQRNSCIKTAFISTTYTFYFSNTVQLITLYFQ